MNYMYRKLMIIILLFQITNAFASTPDAILNYQKTDLKIKNNKLIANHYFEIQINNHDGEKYADISIPYSKLNKVSGIQAYLKTPDGFILKKLKSSEIKVRNEISDFSFYEDNFVKEFTLIHNVYPYILCYQYEEQSDNFLYLINWLPVIDSDVPTLQSDLNITVPANYKINYISQFTDSLTTDTVGEEMTYHWHIKYSDNLVRENFMPPLSDFIPFVKVVPENFKYDLKGSLGSWKEYGNWQYSLLDGLTELPESEMSKIHRLIDNVADLKERIKILYHYLQDETRYINISIETGGLKPYPASYVATNKYGDCKALSNYFIALLKIAGINSYYTKVYAGDVIKKININFPSQQFNHIIVCVPIKTDTLWLDCTSDGPFNNLGTFSQGRNAFFVDKDNSHFVKTPALRSSDVHEIRNIIVNSTISNGIKVNVNKRVRGELFDGLNYLAHSVNDSKKDKIIRNNFIENGFDLIDYKLITANRDSNFIDMQYSAKADKLFKKYGNELLIKIIPFDIPAFKDPANRKFPVQINFPVFKTDTLKYYLPENLKLTENYKLIIIETKFGKYNIRVIKLEDRVEVIKNFELFSGYYPLNEYPEFYAFIKKVSDSENFSYLITSYN